MDSFTDLLVWKKGLKLAEEVYRITIQFPQSELYGMTSQMRRSATSVLANTAEGFGRYTYPDKANKYTIARGECTEVHALLLLAEALNFASTDQVKYALELANEVGRLLSGLITACRKHS